MLKAILKFFLKSLSFLIPAFFIQWSIVFLANFKLTEYFISSYVFNFTAALIIYSGTYYFSMVKSLNAILFLTFGSIAKMFLFFIFLYPQFISDGDVQPIEVFIFFVPYFTCLIIEINELSKFLNTRV